MRRSSFDETRDQRIANESGVPRELMCSVFGCPNRWAVDSSDKGIARKCSAHAWCDPQDEAHITAKQQDAETDRARHVGQERAEMSEPLTFEQKKAILMNLRELSATFGRKKS